jgi:uncharacterized membrane protein
MIDFIENNNLSGIIIGLFTFIIIGLFHPLVIKVYYYWGTKSWASFLILGIISIILSVSITNFIISTICSIIAFSSFWSILEIFHQGKRVQKGWFPANPNRKNK